MVFIYISLIQSRSNNLKVATTTPSKQLFIVKLIIGHAQKAAQRLALPTPTRETSSRSTNDVFVLKK